MPKKITLDQLSAAIAQCVDNWDMETLIVYAQDTMTDAAAEKVFNDGTARYVILEDSDGSFLAGPFDLETALSEAEFFDHAHVAELEIENNG